MYHLRFAALFLPLLLAGCSLGAATYDTGSTTESDPLASPPSPLNNQLLPNLEEGGIVSFEDERYGTRHNVTYTVLEGQAIIDGDVIYGPVDLLLNASLPLEEPSANQYARKRRALSSLKAYTWPGGEVRFNYDSTATEVMLSPIVNAAINEWRARAPYLKFSQVSNALGSMTGILTIKAVPCGGCVANIGYYQEFPGTMMNLQQSCNIPGANGRCTVPEAIHEMGHALGLWHEHQRADREQTVHYNCANLAPGPSCVGMAPTATCCDANVPAGCCASRTNFDVITAGYVDAGGPYDVASIMQYPGNAFAKPGTLTLTPARPGVVIPSFNPTAESGGCGEDLQAVRPGVRVYCALSL